jgi:hypothetical protein
LFLTRLRNYSRLPPAEKALAVRAIVWLVLARVALRLFPFDRARASIAEARPADAHADDAWPRMVRRAVLRAARSLPGSTCLAQSLVAERLLHQGGSPAKLRIGVAPAVTGYAPRVTLDAHAWVESGGMLVTGDDPHGRYQVLATFGAE